MQQRWVGFGDAVLAAALAVAAVVAVAAGNRLEALAAGALAIAWSAAAVRRLARRGTTPSPTGGTHPRTAR